MSIEKKLRVVRSSYYFKAFAHTEEVRALEAGDSILCCPWVTDDEVENL